MFYVIAVIVIVGALLSVYRLRQGGPGPATNGIPRGLRGKVNSMYRRAGWQQPYDSKGNRST